MEVKLNWDRGWWLVGAFPMSRTRGAWPPSKDKGQVTLPKRMNFRKSSNWPLPHFQKIMLQFFPKKPCLRSKICNMNFWIENDPPLFQKSIRFVGTTGPLAHWEYEWSSNWAQCVPEKILQAGFRVLVHWTMSNQGYRGYAHLFSKDCCENCYSELGIFHLY